MRPGGGPGVRRSRRRSGLHRENMTLLSCLGDHYFQLVAHMTPVITILVAIALAAPVTAGVVAALGERAILRRVAAALAVVGCGGRGGAAGARPDRDPVRLGMPTSRWWSSTGSRRSCCCCRSASAPSSSVSPPGTSTVTAGAPACWWPGGGRHRRGGHGVRRHAGVPTAAWIVTTLAVIWLLRGAGAGRAAGTLLAGTRRCSPGRDHHRPGR